MVREHHPRIVLQRDVTLQDLVTLADALGGKLLKRCGGGIDLSDGNGRRDIRFCTSAAYNKSKGMTFWIDADGNFKSPLETVCLWVGDDLFDASTALDIRAIDQPPFTPDEIGAIVAATAIAFGARPSVIHNRYESAGTEIRRLGELNHDTDADINDFVMFDFKAAVDKFTRPDPDGILEERRFECWMCKSWCSSWNFMLDAERGGMSSSTDKLTFVTVLGRRVYQPRTACTNCVHDLGTETRPQKRKRAAVVPPSPHV